MDEAESLAELSARLQQAIAGAGGVLPFEEFMRRALYEPDLGYYERTPDRVGRDGDFYTSVSVGSVFGELLGWQLAAWLNPFGPDAQLVEAGAHDGRLAADILGWLRAHCPKLSKQVRYTIVEPLAARQAWQRSRLSEFGDQVHWATQLPPTCGVIFSNELLDAFPVRAVCWNAGTQGWHELGVEWTGAQFRERTMPLRLETPAPNLPDELLAVLPNGFTTETSPTADACAAPV